MKLTLFDLMRHCSNFFIDEVQTGRFTVSPEGKLPLPAGAYGVLQAEGLPLTFLDAQEPEPLTPGEVTGTLYICRPTADFIRLLDAINTWLEANPDPALTGERLGEYSRTGGGSWVQAFSAQLLPYRRMFTEV